MKLSLHNLSLTHKLRMLMMTIATTAVLIACAAFAVVDFRTFQAMLRHDSETLGGVVAEESAAALMFNDHEAAYEVLGALRAKPSVIGAALFDMNGKPFAAYDAKGGEVFKPHALEQMRRVAHPTAVEVYRDVLMDGKRVGTIHIRSDIRIPPERVRQYLVAAALIVFLSLLAAFGLSAGLERLISAPITELADAAHEITHAKNYSTRVYLQREVPQNEIGNLIVSFNDMLAEIERRDEQLKRHSTDLEIQVALRTAELSAANVQLRAARDAAELAAIAHQSLGRRKQLILDSAAEGIFGLDSQGFVEFINRSAAQMLGWKIEDVVGTQMHDLIHPANARTASHADCPICSHTIEPAVRIGKRGTFVQRSGETIPIEYTASTMLDGSSQPSGVVVTFRDITERLAIDRMKDEFVSTVSHELRTPLTSIRGALGLLASGLIGNLSERAQRMLDIAVSNTDRLVRLINDILDLERIDSGRVELNRTTSDAADLITEARDGIQGFADRAGVQVEIEPLHDALWVDHDRIIQTLTNLLSNAVKFSPRGSLVRVSGQRGRDVFTFIVEDHGRGIPASHLESIFERFKQVDSSDSRNKNGTGLGLAICRSIVNAHGGRIWAESIEGHGTTFRFTVPISASAAEPEERRRTIIVYGSEPLQKVFGDRGYDVTVCKSVKQLCATTSRLKPHAIVIDMVEPDEQMLRLIETLKTNPAGRDVPVIVAAGSPAPMLDHFADLIARWVLKPCSETEIVDAVANVCEPPTVLIVEDDVDLARLIVDSLHARGVDTRHAVTGREAIDACRTVAPKVLVLDLGLPDIDGFAVVEWMKSNRSLAETPLVVYSAREVSTADQERLRLGPTEFLTKSRVSLEEFESRVIDLLNRVSELAA
jgi:PAS domain S-box-containing protein